MSTDAPGAGPAHVAAVLAVKRLAAAKSRLTERPDDAAHRRLVLAMFDDTLASVRAAGLDRLVVVSPDPQVRRAARRRGALTLTDPPPPAGARGPELLNSALRHAAEQAIDRWPQLSRIAYVQADLPAARSGNLREALGEGLDRPAAFLADRSGTGTAILIAPAGFAPRFGPGSAQAHRLAGARELDPGGLRWPDLCADVDTVDDLRHAVAIGTGPGTREALRQHRLTASPAYAPAGIGPLPEAGCDTA